MARSASVPSLLTVLVVGLAMTACTSAAPTASPPGKGGSALHADPSLEAVLPDAVGGVALEKESWTGVDQQLADADPMLQPFGKHPADFEAASAVPASRTFEVSVQRLRGVSADQLLDSQLGQTPDAKVTDGTLGGRQVREVVYQGGPPVWYYASGDLLFEVSAPRDVAAAALGGLP